MKSVEYEILLCKLEQHGIRVLPKQILKFLPKEKLRLTYGKETLMWSDINHGISHSSVLAPL